MEVLVRFTVNMNLFENPLFL